MRKRLYFDRDIGPYEAGLWYDNVPDDDFAAALEFGLARPVEDDPECGCRVVEGRAVSLSAERYTGAPCPRHVGDALIGPKKHPDAKSLYALAEEKGLARVNL
jgi:hypothetical protein